MFKNWASHLFDDDNNNGEPPRLAVPEELQDDEENGMPAHDEAPGFYSPALRAKSMLILSAASKSLRESDFLRLGMKGKHVEGWVGGILKGKPINQPTNQLTTHTIGNKRRSHSRRHPIRLSQAQSHSPGPCPSKNERKKTKTPPSQ